MFRKRCFFFIRRLGNYFKAGGYVTDNLIGSFVYRLAADSGE